MIQNKKYGCLSSESRMVSKENKYIPSLPVH